MLEPLSQKETEVEKSTSLVPLPQETVSLEAVQARTGILKEAIKGSFKREKHFGKIPGTQHDTLWKPGCELILAWHKLHEDPLVIEHMEEWGFGDKPAFFHFLVRSTIYRYVPGPNGEPVRVDMGSAVGEANTGEPRYSHRWTWPNKMSDAMHKKAKAEGWEFREARNGGKQYKCPTTPEEVRGQYNTILKMAQIRALRSSLAKVCATSEFFGEEDEQRSSVDRDTGEVIHNAEVVRPNKKTSTATSAATAERVAQQKFLKDFLAKDPKAFMAKCTLLFGDTYKGKPWKDWKASDMGALKHALAAGGAKKEPPVQQEEAWDPETEPRPKEAPAEAKTYHCGNCKAEITEDRAALYHGAPGGALCQDCSKKAHDERIETALNHE